MILAGHRRLERAHRGLAGGAHVVGEKLRIVRERLARRREDPLGLDALDDEVALREVLLGVLE